MQTENAKQVLADMIKQAVAYSQRRDVVLRNQTLRNIEELPLSHSYVKASIKAAGLK